MVPRNVLKLGFKYITLNERRNTTTISPLRLSPHMRKIIIWKEDPLPWARPGEPASSSPQHSPRGAGQWAGRRPHPAPGW
jgi:hypothetical protein